MPDAEAERKGDVEPVVRRESSRWLPAAALIAAAAVLLAIVLATFVPVISPFARALIWLSALLVATWGLIRLLRRLLWRVGHRLAVSYFLIGVLPIPMVAVMSAVGLYLLSGFFLAHQARTALLDVDSEVRTVAALAVDTYSLEDARSASPYAHVSLAFYEDGQRTYGSHTAPERWPEWLESSGSALGASADPRRTPDLVALGDGALTVVSGHTLGDRAVIAYFDGNLQRHLTERSSAWIELTRKGDPDAEAATRFQIGNNEWTFQPLRRAEVRGSVEEFFAEQQLTSQTLIVGLDALGPVYDLQSGELLSENVSATIFAPPRAIIRRLFANSREVDTLAWVAFILPAFLLFDLYIVAAVMAIFLIAGLSRAVNQLSAATNRVQSGDFSGRIEVRRRDQLGALQTSFNEMTENLERAVENATQKELIDKELEIARDLQRSLLPVQLQFGDRIEVASYFEPSAAIGGDYYDIVPLNEERTRLAIAIADVSGHGLPAGLRTAMLKAALEILVRERKDADEIFRALDNIVRSGTERAFVTATLTVIDLDTGNATITNAGHCPTYLLRADDQEVEEIVLPGTPLGALQQRYGHQRVPFGPGDTLVWLSDGLIEAEDPDGDVFGYDRTLDALNAAHASTFRPPGEGAQPHGSAELVRDRLVDAVRRWARQQPAQDDRTLVVLRARDEPNEEQ